MVDRVTIDMSGLKSKLKMLNDGLKSSTYLAAMQQSLIAWVARNFQAEGIERRWPQMSPNTRAARRGGGGGARLLQNTGILRASFAPSHSQSASRIDEGAMQVSVGTSVQYAPFHEFGTKPYVIRPKAGGTLAFMTASGFRRAKVVNHPGVPHRRMLPSPAVAKRTVMATLKAALNRMLERAKSAGK